MKNRIYLLLLFAFLFSTVVTYGQQADDLIGVWEPSNGKVKVKIRVRGNRTDTILSEEGIFTMGMEF